MDIHSRLESGETLYGSVVTLTTPQATEALARAGFDWLWIDMEHGPLDLATVQHLMLGSGDACSSLVRVPANDPVWLKRVLDLGPDGVIVPHVDSAEEARAAVSSCLYPPRGIRSVGIGRAQGYGADMTDYLATAHQSVMVIPQIEHRRAVEEIDEILAIDTIRSVVVGPFDLSASLGYPGQFDHPEVVTAIQKVLDACARVGKHAGLFAGTPEFAQQWIDRGYRLVAIGADVSLLQQAAGALLDGMRGGSGAKGE